MFVFICGPGIEPRTLSMLVKYSTTKLHPPNPRFGLKGCSGHGDACWEERSCGGGVATNLQGPGRLEENFHILAWAEVR